MEDPIKNQVDAQLDSESAREMEVAEEKKTDRDQTFPFSSL